MVDCKCYKNLCGFAASRPPCFVFTVCLAAFAIGLFSLGYFVQMYGWFNDVDDIQNKEWHSFLDHLGSSEFCIFGNQSFLGNATFANSTNITGPTPAGFTTVTIPLLHLSITPSGDFGGLVNNVTHVTAEMPATELGLTGSWGNFVVNVTLTLSQPWAMDCQENKKCKSMYVETCGSVTIPTDIVPEHLLSTSTCNMSTGDVSILKMINIEKHARTVYQEVQQCDNGIRAETSLPLDNQRSPTTRAMSLVDASAVNLRLQYSSYFLFVMVITCVLYGMIKGKPSKLNFNKKTNLPL